MKGPFRRWCPVLFGIVGMVLLVLAGETKAQTFRGTILGTVTDSSGAALSGATVTVKNTDTGLVRTAKTSDDGSYVAPELPIGRYSVTVENAGFKTAVVTGIIVEVSSERRADVTLTPGEVAQRVEVSGDSLPQVESTNNILGGIIESKVVTNLPVNGRDYQKLIFLVPGVTGSPDQITDSPGSFGVFSVNGARGRSNNFLLDGTDMNDGYRNDPAINEAGVFGTPATILPLEAIAELRVLSNFEAEYGRSAGGVINIVTKSGTNQFHGSAFDYFRNTVLNARNFFNFVQDPSTGAHIPENPFHDNQFGAALGGPIKRDKTFFYGDYEGTRETGAESSLACVPTAADISNNTPAGGINPVIQSLLNQKGWPQANLGGSCITAPGDAIPQTAVQNNASLATPFSNRVDSAIIKIDHQITANNLLTGRYYFGDSSQSFPLALTGGGLLPNYNTFTPTRVQLVSLSFVSSISPATVNEARLGWNRFAEGFFPEDRSFDPASIGLSTGATAYNFGLPTITVAPFAQLGADKGDPRQRVDTNWHFIDNVSWKRGRHDIKFGYEFRRTSISQIFNRTARGTLDFGTFSDFLAGIPDGGTQIFGDTNRNTFENSHAGYVQDSIHAARNVTITLGLRYDYFGIMQEKHGLFTNIDPTNGELIDLGKRRLYQPDYNNWAPRVSVAWDLSGKGTTVVRAGYGIFYDAFSQDFFMGHLPFNSSFDPGPAYNGFGPNPISFNSAATTPLAAGVPVYGGPAPMADAFGVDPNLRTPYMENFNLNLQQQFGRHNVVQVGYVGSQGHKLFRFRDINQPGQAAIDAFDYAGNDGCCVPRVFAATSPYFYINFQESSASSNYNALQASWRINDWHGITSTLNYTWSHSIDTASDGEDFVPNAAQPNDSTNPSGNRGNSNFDVRNRFTWNFIYQFPNRRGDWKRLTDGWGINGIVTLQSGQPFQLNYNFEDDYDGSGEFFGRPDVVGPISYNHSDPTQFLNLTSFAVPCTLVGGTAAINCVNGSFHFGNEGRNSLVGPHFRQFDFSVFKNTALTERLKLELRFETYNLFNHPNFANPYLPAFIADAAAGGISDGTGGVPIGRSLGVLPLKATGDVGIGYPFLGSGGPRTMQIAAKFTF
jgi:Carboxypeptidase regulatory-like domain/TonB-dependent Receptor Plug Domain